MTSDSRSKYRNLVKLLQKYNQAYYQNNAPLIPDDEYDSLMSELRRIEESNPDWIDPQSPTLVLGETTTSNFKTVAHRIPMLSIDNTYSDEELLQFDLRIRKLIDLSIPVSFVSELKLDGISLALHYYKGKLIRALTRGDGRSGDDVTQNAKEILGIPAKLTMEKISPPDELEVRGEVYICKEDFLRINEEREELGLDIFANPRNAAAGTLKMLDSSAVKSRSLRFSAHGIGYLSDSKWFSSFKQLYERYQLLGLPLASRYKICSDIKLALAHCHSEKKVRSGLPFEVDGMVIKVNENIHHQTLGYTAKSPRFMVAFKFPAERKKTRVTEVCFQIGRTGIVTPVANLEPVLISGSTVSRATLHNFDEIHRLGLKIGDEVALEKSGDIIPKIVQVFAESRTGSEKPVQRPIKCPACNEVLTQIPGEVAIRCLNRSCESVVKAGLIHFASRKAMDIEGLGDKMAELLLKTKTISAISDLFFLKTSDIIHLERMAEKSASKFIQAIENSKKQGLARLIFALGIPHIGEKIALVLAQRFKHMKYLKVAIEADLLNINDMGPIATRNILLFFKNPRNIKLIDELSRAGVLMESTDRPADASGPLTGQSVVVTGTLQQFTRDQIHALIRRLGGSPTGSISKKTALLIVGEDAGSKLKKAKDLNISIISEQSFIQQYVTEES